jgi:hypothetical protein
MAILQMSERRVMKCESQMGHRSCGLQCAPDQMRPHVYFGYTISLFIWFWSYKGPSWVYCSSGSCLMGFSSLLPSIAQQPLSWFCKKLRSFCFYDSLSTSKGSFLYCRRACSTKSFSLRMVNFHQHGQTTHTYESTGHCNFYAKAILILRGLSLSGAHCW